MDTSISMTRILSQAWKATYSNPTLLVYGLAFSVVSLLLTNIFSFFFAVTSSPAPVNISSLLPLINNWISVLLLFLAVCCLTVIKSQIYILSAARQLNRNTLLTTNSRLKNTFVYLFIESATALIVFCCALPLLVFLFIQPDFITSIHFVTKFLLVSSLLLLSITISIIKHLFVGYALLTPIRLQSAFGLALHLFLRYRQISLSFGILFLGLSLLFTFLQNLVILQGAFLLVHFQSLMAVGIAYIAILLLRTIGVLFFEILWIEFFLEVTQKRPLKQTLLSPSAKEALEIPPVI